MRRVILTIDAAEEMFNFADALILTVKFKFMLMRFYC